MANNFTQPPNTARDNARDIARETTSYTNQRISGHSMSEPVEGGRYQNAGVEAHEAHEAHEEGGGRWGSVRWGAIWAGLLTTLMTFLLLELLAYGLGLLTQTNNNGSLTASGASPWVTGLLGLIAFFLGGYVAARFSGAQGTSSGLLNGVLVWALGITLILLLSVLGLGSLFGALGNIAGSFLASGGSVPNGSNVNVNANQVAQITQGAALGGFFSLLLSAAAAALGGLLGSQGRGNVAGFLSPSSRDTSMRDTDVRDTTQTRGTQTTRRSHA